MDNNEAITLLQRAVDRADAMLEMAELVPTDARAIIRMLKEQEPRIMTLDEVKNLRSLYDGAVWLEALSGLFPVLPEICMPNITFFVAIPFDHYHGYFDNKYYGKTWRCWTARPTHEQMEATKWDKLED